MPSMCLRTRSRGPRRVALAQQPDQFAVLVVGAGQHLLGMGDQRDQPAHVALDLGHRRDQARRARCLGDADVEADIGAPVVLELIRGCHLLHQLVEAVEVVGGPARRRGSRRRSRSRPGSRAPPRPPRRGARLPASRSAIGGRSATKVPPLRPRTETRWPLWTRVVSAWRRVEREILSSLASSRSAGSWLPGASSPTRIAVPSRSTVSSKVVGGRTGLNTASRATSLVIVQTP